MQEAHPQRRRALAAKITVRPLRESDLPVADHIMRLAFGTFLGLPDPLTFMGDAGYVRTRWLAAPTAAFAAELDGELVGSNFASNWGSVGFFGPLTVRPDLWDQGIAHRLLEPTMELFAQWGTRHTGLFTFPHSPKHIHLYQKFDFWARFLTPIMAKPVAPLGPGSQWSKYSELPERGRQESLAACRELTNAIYEGLDLEREIQAVDAQKLGDTVLLWDDTQLIALAVCHCGPGTEAGSGTCYIKFGTVRPGPTAGQHFDRLLDACEELAAAQGVSRLAAGVNMSHHDAYRKMIARGFRTELEGVAMHKSNEPGYHRPDVYVIDDWR